jgi:hypothetical protein
MKTLRYIIIGLCTIDALFTGITQNWAACSGWIVAILGWSLVKEKGGEEQTWI